VGTNLKNRTAFHSLVRGPCSVPQNLDGPPHRLWATLDDLTGTCRQSFVVLCWLVWYSSLGSANPTVTGRSGNSWPNDLVSRFVCFASCCVHHWIINKIILGLNYDKIISIALNKRVPWERDGLFAWSRVVKQPWHQNIII
jgi:hypothetical protein